jgi:hypothetical protein
MWRTALEWGGICEAVSCWNYETAGAGLLVELGVERSWAGRHRIMRFYPKASRRLRSREAACNPESGKAHA